MLYQKTTTILKVKRGGVYMYVIPKDYNNTEGKKGGIYVCYTKRLQQY